MGEHVVARRASERGQRPDGGLPVPLRHAYERASGVSMDGVTVRRNSPAPARIGAHAFTQGDQIHLAPGQERHLAHEAWHVVQQRQGRVRPSGSLGGQPLNADPALESEADRMAARVPQLIRRSSAEGASRIRRGVGPPQPAADAVPVPRIRRAMRRPSIVQGRWNHVTPELLERFGNNPLRLLLEWSAEVDDQLGERARLGAQVLAGLLDPRNDLFRLGDARQRVLTFLGRTLTNEEGGYDLDYLLAQIPIQAEVAERQANELEGPSGDHLEDEVQPPAPTEPVSLHNLHELDLDEIRDTDPVLDVIATRIEQQYGVRRPDDDLKTWFEFLMVQWEQHVAVQGMIANGGDDGEVVQAKFRAGTVSGPKNYTGLHGHAYTGVSYTRNAVGSIDFDAPTAQTSWVDPVNHGSLVELSTGSGSATKGLLQDGSLVRIAHANRNQHFDIANRIAGNGYGATSPPLDTWHHLVQEYEMVLVDFVVHQKHGHNGGVLYWR